MTDALISEAKRSPAPGPADSGTRKKVFIALWGNGVDAFNNYRRTGKPGSMSFTVAQAGGNMIRSHYYPSVLVNLNKNITQKTIDKQVFWDNNPAGFIK
jgi:hypothetical protein